MQDQPAAGPGPARSATNSWGVPLPPDLRGGPVVVGVDDGQACVRPLRAALFLARCTDRPLVLVHVRRRLIPVAEGYIPSGDDLQFAPEIEQQLDEALIAELAGHTDLAGVSWELVSTYGEAATELIRVAVERDAACVVVGRRHTGFAEVLHRIVSGSVSRAVVAQSHEFPVMVVP